MATASANLSSLCSCSVDNLEALMALAFMVVVDYVLTYTAAGCLIDTLHKPTWNVFSNTVA